MKTTICPTDYGLMASNAVNYAKAFCKAIHSELVLVDQPAVAQIFTHPQHARVPHSIGSGSRETARYAQKASSADYQYNADPVSQIHHIHNIAGAALTEQAGLIVSGAEKEFGFNDIHNQLIANLAKQARCPVLLVPEGITFKPIKKMVLVIDHDFDITHRMPFIARIGQAFGAEVFFLQINKERDMIIDHPFFAGSIDMYLAFPYQSTTFYEEINECIPEAIRSFSQKVKADLVITVPNQDEQLPYSQANSLHYNEITAKPLTTPLLAIDALPKQLTTEVGYPFN